MQEYSLVDQKRTVLSISSLQKLRFLPGVLGLVISALRISLLLEGEHTIGSILLSLIGIYLVGYHIRKIIAPRISAIDQPEMAISRILMDILLGTLSLLTLVVFLGSDYLLVSYTIVIPYFLLLSLLSTRCLLLRSNIPRVTLGDRTTWIQVLAIMIATLYGLGIAFYFKIYSNYQSIVDQDIVTHILRSNFIQSQGGFPALFIKDGIRPIAYDSFIAGVAILFGFSSPYAIYSNGVYIIIPLYSFVTFSLSIAITKSAQQATVAAIVASSVCGFWYLAGPDYVEASTLSILLMLSLLTIGFQLPKYTWSWLIFFLISIPLVSLGYYYTLVVYLPVLIGTYALSEAERSWRSKLAMSTLPYLLILFAVIVNGNVFASAAPPITFSTLVDIFLASYTPLIVTFFVIGTGVTLLVNKNWRTSLALSYSLFILALFLLPISEASRLEVYATPFVSVISTSLFNPKIQSMIVNYWNRVLGNAR